MNGMRQQARQHLTAPGNSMDGWVRTTNVVFCRSYYYSKSIKEVFYVQGA